MEINILENRFHLGTYPTPLENLGNLSKQFPGYNIFIKRDDNTGLATGGNKTRKLEYLISDALKKDSNVILTAGAQQSNHCRQTAAACAKANLKCYLLLGGDKPEKFEGNLLLSILFGAQIIYTKNNRKGEDIEAVYSKLKSQGHRPYIIPYGGSNELGVLGYINATNELKTQLKNARLNIDYIFTATSSGATLAGLILGKKLFNLSYKILGINIDKNEVPDKSINNFVVDLMEKTNKKFSLNLTTTVEDVTILKEYDRPGYGVLTENEKFAIRLLAQSEGILLDPVYTGRSFYGMLDTLKKKEIKPNSNILFWHTGGIPSIFTENYLDLSNTHILK